MDQLSCLWTALLNASLLTLFSSFLPSMGDVALYILLLLASFIGQAYHMPGFSDGPPLPLQILLHPGSDLLSKGSMDANALSVCILSFIAALELCGAVLVMRRRDISYVSGA
jgi:hypothetical protein